MLATFPAFFLLVFFSYSALSSELTTAESSGLNQYCETLYELHSLPANKKDAFCSCFLNEAEKLDPTVRKAIILIADDPEVGEQTKNNINALISDRTDEEAEQLIQQVKSFPDRSGAICAKTLR